MGAALDDLAGLEHEDRVAAARGGDAVGDENDGAVRGLALDRREDRRLGLGVDGGERVVEHQDRRLAHEGAGEGDALPLAAGELDAALADDGVEALGSDCTSARTSASSAAWRMVSVPSGALGIVERVADVARDRRREQERVLLRIADAGAHGLEREIADVVPVEEHRARGRGQEAREQDGDGALARPGAADDRQRAAGRDLEADAVDDLARAVREGEVLDADRAVDVIGRGQRAALHLGDGSEDDLEALVPGAAALDDREDEAEGEHRPDEAEQREPERDEVALADLAREDEAAAVPEDDEDADGADPPHHRPHRSADARQGEVLLQEGDVRGF